jgi:hypothetical protein
VDVYKKVHPTRYAFVVRKVSAERAALKDKRFATTGMDAAERLAYCLDEELEYAIAGALCADASDEAAMLRAKWFKSGEGADWFCKRFPEFAFAQDV